MYSCEHWQSPLVCALTLHGARFWEVLCAVPNGVCVILTQDTGRVREGSITGIQTICAQVRRNNFLDQGFQFQIIFSHTFRLMNPLKY